MSHYRTDMRMPGCPSDGQWVVSCNRRCLPTGFCTTVGCLLWRPNDTSWIRQSTWLSVRCRRRLQHPCGRSNRLWCYSLKPNSSMRSTCLRESCSHKTSLVFRLLFILGSQPDRLQSPNSAHPSDSITTYSPQLEVNGSSCFLSGCNRQFVGLSSLLVLRLTSCFQSTTEFCDLLLMTLQPLIRWDHVIAHWPRPRGLTRILELIVGSVDV